MPTSETSSLFEDQSDFVREEQASYAGMPLAARMRPRTLDEFVGQEALVGPGTLLRKAIEDDRLSSAIFWGPPGCGKSTLAAVIARTTKAAFENFSAVTSGVPEIRKVIERARERRDKLRQKTILFIDEIHRWNKAQQDALLPHVEDGTIVLIGATTENPYFEVNAPLISRSRIYRFERLPDEAIGNLLQRALEDPDRGFGQLRIEIDDDAKNHLIQISGGDARNALNALEAAVRNAEGESGRAGEGETNHSPLTIHHSPVTRVGESGREGEGENHDIPSNSPFSTPGPELSTLDSRLSTPIRITLRTAEEAAQQRALMYDKESDQHYDTISAFIKSVRGSDPDAALYWLAKMILAGEDPRFIARRLVILASEDIGNADPMGIVVANAAAQAVMFIGLPEGQLCLAQATTYLATAPKSNASMLGIFRAMEDIKTRGAAPVPIHLRDAHYPSAKKLDHGKGYQYPHDFPNSYVPQEYAPQSARSGPYYEPTENGEEAEIRKRMEEWKRRMTAEG